MRKEKRKKKVFSFREEKPREPSHLTESKNASKAKECPKDSKQTKPDLAKANMKKGLPENGVER